jgi:hypothetical protein
MFVVCKECAFKCNRLATIRATHQSNFYLFDKLINLKHLLDEKRCIIFFLRLLRTTVCFGSEAY